MDEQGFRAELARDDYDETVVIEWEANRVLDQHTHDYDVRLLVLDGELTVTREGTPYTCRAGDTGELDAGTLHSERVGPEGVRFLVGRKRREPG